MCFIGAAIENSMAEEIFTQISMGVLSYAANFTVEEQVSELVSWLVAL
ncbi:MULTISPECIES: AvaI/BsoBI family type II restriction endonuclease [Spirulina sp. CCY15215]